MVAEALVKAMTALCRLWQTSPAATEIGELARALGPGNGCLGRIQACGSIRPGPGIRAILRSV
jgi:hypothetical protein